MLIARLIADTDALETCLGAAKAEGLSFSIKMLSARNALELRFESDDIAGLRKLMDEHLGTCDAIISNQDIAVPSLFISDMDSTMIGQECIDELADFAGLKEKIADITERAMQGELDFEDALRERVGLLKGLGENSIQQCLDERIRPNPGARVLVETLKSKGCRTVLVTGGFHHFADNVAEQIGFERVVGNRLDVEGGVMTGGLNGPITDSSVKKQVLEEETANFCSHSKSMAAGDGANDIPMLQASDYGIAYYAKPKARAASNGWIDKGDLTVLLALLDIPESEWVS